MADFRRLTVEFGPFLPGLDPKGPLGNPVGAGIGHGLPGLGPLLGPLRADLLLLQPDGLGVDHRLAGRRMLYDRSRGRRGCRRNPGPDRRGDHLRIRRRRRYAQCHRCHQDRFDRHALSIVFVGVDMGAAGVFMRLHIGLFIRIHLPVGAGIGFGTVIACFVRIQTRLFMIGQ